MIGLDTNVIIRYIVQDDLNQSKLASQVIEKTINRGKTLWINLVTLCEVIWVLEGCYDTSKKELICVLTEILHIPQIEIEHRDVVLQALLQYKQSSSVGFSDCLIGCHNLHRKCSITHTFDKAAAKHLSSFFQILS